jgi:hypothetical protein
MTSSDSSSPRRFGSASRDEASECPKCGGERVWRPAQPYPVAIQIAFAVSFAAFLASLDRLRQVPNGKLWMWVWTGAQVILGAFLVVQRNRAKRRVLRCIRCE